MLGRGKNQSLGMRKKILKAIRPYHLIPIIEEGKSLHLIDREHNLQYYIKQVDKKTAKIEILGYRNNYRYLQRFGKVERIRQWIKQVDNTILTTQIGLKFIYGYIVAKRKGLVEQFIQQQAEEFNINEEQIKQLCSEVDRLLALLL